VIRILRTAELVQRHGGWSNEPSPSSVTFVKLAERYRASDRLHPYRNDAIAGGVLLALTVIGDRMLTKPLLDARTMAISALGCAGIALRRRFPITALALGTGLLTWVFSDTRDATIESILFWSSLYTVGTLDGIARFGPSWIRTPERTRNAARAAAVSSVAIGFGIFVGRGLLADPGNPDTFVNNVFAMLLGFSFLGAGWFIGDLVRTRRENDAELERQNVELTMQREAIAQRAVLDERVRIARELHDVVAHHVSLMGVQAGAARLAVRQRPEKAEAALSEVERSSRQAVSELQRLLGFLRQDESDSMAPQPMLSDLSTLVADVERAGRPVQLSTLLADDAVVPSSVQLTAYRIVQEALTNALKHSTGASIDVRVESSGHDLLVSVHDHGTPLKRNGASPATGGHGLAGIRERVAFHGGKLTIAPSATGFSVDAALPNVVSM
jgi:signal transduction histidine kinase